MKNLLYVAIVAFGIIAASCTEEVVAPRIGEDDPIIIPPPPIKP